MITLIFRIRILNLHFELLAGNPNLLLKNGLLLKITKSQCTAFLEAEEITRYKLFPY